MKNKIILNELRSLVKKIINENINNNMVAKFGTNEFGSPVIVVTNGVVYEIFDFKKAMVQIDIESKQFSDKNKVHWSVGKSNDDLLSEPGLIPFLKDNVESFYFEIN